jgi:hypothetical protein
VAQTIATQPVISGALGLLTLVVTPALFLVLAITIILIPLGLIGLLIFGLALLFGWIALGLDMGNRMATLFHTQWSTPVSAGLGTLVLSLVVNLALVVTGEWWWLLCCVGLPLVGVLMMVGLGGVVASKFGTAVYLNSAALPVSPAPGSWPVTPPMVPQNYAQPGIQPNYWNTVPVPQPPQPVEPPPPANPPLSEFIQPPDSGLPPASAAPAGDQPASPPPPPDLRKRDL